MIGLWLMLISNLVVLLEVSKHQKDRGSKSFNRVGEARLSDGPTPTTASPRPCPRFKKNFEPDFEPWKGFRFDHGYMIIPTRYEFIKKLLEELGPGDEKKTKEFIEFVQKTRNNFVYIRNCFTFILYGHSKKWQINDRISWSKVGGQDETAFELPAWRPF